MFLNCRATRRVRLDTGVVRAFVDGTRSRNVMGGSAVVVWMMEWLLVLLHHNF